MKPTYNFEERKFNINFDKIKGLSKKSIEEHIKLYVGYVKHANLVKEKILGMKEDLEKNTYSFGEINRRFSFEFNGMRNHENYFNSIEGEATPIDTASELYKKISDTWGTFDNWLAEFKLLSLTRGIGWAMLYKDNSTGDLINTWVDEQHLGQLQNCTLILGMDMWEHSYVADYMPSGKKQYIEDFLANINWKNVEARF